MAKETIKIAFYGKGGIGKSTIASNISVALAKEGAKVLHIGCDPKSDSTRYIRKEKTPTVLQQINLLGEDLKREDIVFNGVLGINCVEAGGPEAGIGCAGLGITAMVEELDRLQIFEEEWDVIIYDVLGDVVCGGFSVPMRKHYVDNVYVVSSSDFMSLYAANNIMKAIKRYSSNDKKIMGGIIHNHCNNDLDRDIMNNFARVTNTKILANIMESNEIKIADYMGCTIIEKFEKSQNSIVFKNIAKSILNKEEGMTPNPLSKEILEEFCNEILLERGIISGE